MCPTFPLSFSLSTAGNEDSVVWQISSAVSETGQSAINPPQALCFPELNSFCLRKIGNPLSNDHPCSPSAPNMPRTKYFPQGRTREEPTMQTMYSPCRGVKQRHNSKISIVASTDGVSHLDTFVHVSHRPDACKPVAN